MLVKEIDDCHEGYKCSTNTCTNAPLCFKSEQLLTGPSILLSPVIQLVDDLWAGCIDLETRSNAGNLVMHQLQTAVRRI